MLKSGQPVACSTEKKFLVNRLHMNFQKGEFPFKVQVLFAFDSVCGTLKPEKYQCSNLVFPFIGGHAKKCTT